MGRELEGLHSYYLKCTNWKDDVGPFLRAGVYKRVHSTSGNVPDSLRGWKTRKCMKVVEWYSISLLVRDQGIVDVVRNLYCTELLTYGLHIIQPYFHIILLLRGDSNETLYHCDVWCPFENEMLN